MNREQKEAVVADVQKMFRESQASYLVHYKGINVTQMQDLRKGLRAQGGQLKVAKANLMRIAAQDVAGIEAFAEQFKDQVGLVFAPKDGVAIAKALVDFSKDNEALRVLSGFFDSSVLSKEQVVAIAALPSREVLVAQVLGTMQAPISGFARVLSTMVARLGYVLNQVIEKQK